VAATSLKSGVLILGAGPTGLGAAWHLHTLGHEDWRLLEAAPHAGGLASSFLDEQGFTWDVGGHVQFSHYDYFDRAMDEFLGPAGWLQHQRESWVWMRERFIPYPLQNNLHQLPPADLDRCRAGLADVARGGGAPPTNFHEWILATFGRGVADVFMLPYNFKVWAYPPKMLGTGWVGQRVAVTDPRRLLDESGPGKDEPAWGANKIFRFPARGGTGAAWRACAERLPGEKLHFNTEAASIDLDRREVTTSGGETFGYENLLSTMPLRDLIRRSGQSQLEAAAQRGLLHSSSNIFGIGLRGTPPPHLRTKCWIYFPEDNCPFYRVTVFSNYSPANVPDSRGNWSLMAEVSESPHKPVDPAQLPEQVIEGLLATRLIERRDDIVSRWQYRAAYGYPTPSLERDAALAEIIPFFEAHGVYPRGRFGLWKYEVSNQDHSFMQGVELVERLLHGRPEITAQNPQVANGGKHAWPFAQWS
jgi:protoporphyrinogen oxidase